jgi:hypothetical protein
MVPNKDGPQCYPAEQRDKGGRKGDSELKCVAWLLPTKESDTELKTDGVDGKKNGKEENGKATRRRKKEERGVFSETS